MIARACRALRRRTGLLADSLRASRGAFRVRDEELPAALGLGPHDDLRKAAEPARGRFFFSDSERSVLAKRFRAEQPQVTESVIDWAERICRREFDLLGSGPVTMTNGIRWYEDFAAGRRWRRRFSALLPVQYSDQSDIKRVWELSRCQHFAVLGEAYALTGDERFAREWVAQMTDWDRQNPPLIGPNWMVPMEAAIRIVNWIWGYAFMGDSPAFTDEARKVFYRNLLSHGRFILRHLEGYGNHRFSNFVGLVFLGVMFPEFKEASGWREAGIKGFCEELDLQVRSDGVHFEGSIPYHRLVLEMAATTWLLLRRNNIELPAASQDAMARMFHFTAACLQPNGFAPQIGDADDGRLQELTRLDKRDHSYLLSLAAVLTGKGEFKSAERPHPEAFWLLGSDGLKAYDALPAAQAEEEPKAFLESGFCVLRSERLHSFISCRRPAARDIGAHSHNDHLSFTLALDGVEFIVDPGTCTYTGDLRVRNEFRSTAAHNTIMVDGREINPLERNDPFRLRDRANCRITESRMNDEEQAHTAEHEGYMRSGIRVCRTFILGRRGATLRINDTLSGSGVHDLTWRFHFAPEVQLDLSGGDLLASRDGRCLRVSLNRKSAPAVSGMKMLIVPGRHSPSYGISRPASVLEVAATCELPHQVHFTLSPAEAGHAPFAQE